MKGPAYRVSRISGLAVNEHRAVVFLESDTDNELNAKSAFELMRKSKKQQKLALKFMTHFDLWIGGGQFNDKYFHGFPNDPKYKECFTFKASQGKKKNLRFYGFLCNPMPKTNKPFRVCVLVVFAVKNDWLTDPKHLALAESLRTNPLVKAYVEMEFPEKGIKQQWQ
jgi:hypothetical protein